MNRDNEVKGGLANRLLGRQHTPSTAQAYELFKLHTRSAICMPRPPGFLEDWKAGASHLEQHVARHHCLLCTVAGLYHPAPTRLTNCLLVLHSRVKNTIYTHAMLMCMQSSCTNGASALACPVHFMSNCAQIRLLVSRVQHPPMLLHVLRALAITQAAHQRPWSVMTSWTCGQQW